jgi:hypothetical protein
MIANSLLIAQVIEKRSPSGKTRTAVGSASKSPEEEAAGFRAQQLRNFRDHILILTLDSLKRMDEVGLRLSARNQILTYLTGSKTPSSENLALASQIALDSVSDLSSHGDEILPFMADYLINDLGAWIQKYQPTMSQKFQNATKTRKVNASQSVSSLFDLKDGDLLVTQRIRQLLEEGSSLDGLFFWLDELMIRKSKGFEPLALEIVARAEQGQLSLENLFWVSRIYLRPQIPSTLQQRFLAMVVARTQPANFPGEPTSPLGYELLTSLLPFIQQSTPELYDQALTQSFAIRASLNERASAGEARHKRLKESINPIEDLIAEAEATKSKSERNELLAQAAELALMNYKFDLCLDIVTRVEPDVPATIPNFWHNWSDQFLKRVVKSALKGKHSEIAQKAAAGITSSLAKVEALNLIMVYWAKAGETVATQRLLLEAANVAGSVSQEQDKAKAFLILSLSCDLADVQKKGELLQSAIKALNNLPKPDSGERDPKSSYQNYVRVLDNTGYELTKGFQALASKDQDGALALIDKLQKPDLRTFALIGVLQGLEGLLAAAPS